MIRTVAEDLEDKNHPSTSTPRLGRLLTVMLPAATAMYALYQGLGQILLPAQVAALDPEGKVGTLAMLTSIGAVATLLGLPAGGAVSDRTVSRFGRRAPWIVVTSVVSGVLMIAMGYTGDIIALGVLYALLGFVSNFYQGAFSAILPDRVPLDRRGVASSVIGLGTPLGILLGVNLAAQLGQIWGYAALGAILVVASLVLVLVAPDSSSRDLPAPDARPVRRFVVSGFLAAFRSRDYTLAFVSRFTLFLAYSLAAGYLFYTLTDYIGAENLPFASVAQAVGLLSSINVIAWVVVATICGWLADRFDLRKGFVAAASVGVALSMVIPIVLPTWEGMVLYSVLNGASIGTYFAVDLALMSLVLPDKANEGRDFGILAVATGLPAVLAAPLASLLIGAAGGYVALYVAGAISAAVAGIVVFGIRSVR